MLGRSIYHMSPLLYTRTSCQQMIHIFSVFTLLLTGAVWSTANESPGDFSESESKECSQEMLVTCAYPLKVLSDNSQDLSFAAKKEELEQLCPNLEKGLRCIDDYTRKCLEPHQRQHFNLLYSDTSIVIQEICQRGPYQEEFLRHAPCMREVKEQYELCTKDYQTKLQEMTQQSQHLQQNQQTQAKTEQEMKENENNIEKLCCSFQEYLRCSKAIMLDKCGEETATFTAGLLQRMSISLIKYHCEKYANNMNVCKTKSSASIPPYSNVWVLSAILILQLVRSLS